MSDTTTAPGTVTARDLTVQYRALVGDLSHARRDLARAHIAHHRARVTGFQSSLGNSVQARDRDADQHALDEHQALVNAELDVALIEDQRLLLRDLMKLAGR